MKDLIKADMPNGKWAHRHRTMAEELARDALTPWRNRELTVEGKRVKIAECLRGAGFVKEKGFWSPPNSEHLEQAVWL